jgi:hypothetical protein
VKTLALLSFVVATGGTALFWPKSSPSWQPPQGFAPEARLQIAFWPAPAGCLAGQSGAIVALRDFARDHPDSEVITLLARGTPWPTTGDLAAPGKLLFLEPSEYEATCCRPGSTPRFEVWTRDGSLLLWRSLTKLEGSGGRLYEELARMRALVPARPDG